MPKPNTLFIVLKKTTNNPQEMWKTINKLLNKKSKTTIISEIKTENGSFTDPKEITNVLNEYFCNIGYTIWHKT